MRNNPFRSEGVGPLPQLSGRCEVILSCQASPIDGIVEEIDEISDEIEDDAVLDAALIAAAQAVEHFEITRYGSLIAWAKMLGREDCASVLAQNLAEEKASDKELTQLAERRINMRSAT